MKEVSCEEGKFANLAIERVMCAMRETGLTVDFEGEILEGRGTFEGVYLEREG